MAKMKAVNAATKMTYPFTVGSVEERTLFRVTSVEPSAGKLYFDSKEQYLAWRTSQLDENYTLRNMGIYMLPGLASKN